MILIAILASASMRAQKKAQEGRVRRTLSRQRFRNPVKISALAVTFRLDSEMLSMLRWPAPEMELGGKAFRHHHTCIHHGLLLVTRRRNIVKAAPESLHPVPDSSLLT